MRKIVQIAAFARGAYEYNWEIGILALCDDGSLWERGTYYDWRRLPNIPQDAKHEHPRGECPEPPCNVEPIF